LLALLPLVNRRCLDERLPEVAAHLIADDTREAARLVEKALSELAGAKVGAEAVNAAGLGKGGALAGNVVRLSRQQEALSRLEAALKEAAGLERRARLLRLSTANAPEAVTRSLHDLRELEALRVVLAQPGKAPLPAVARVEAMLAAVQRVAGGDPAVIRVRQDVSARLFLEGRAGEARKVLAGCGPSAEPWPHAGSLLRDLKAVVLGEGKVSTVAVASALPPAGSGKSTRPRGPASVLRDLATAGKARDWKPPMRERPLTDPGPVVDVERWQSKLEGRLEAVVRQARSNGAEQTRSLARQIQAHLRAAQPPTRSAPKSSSLSDR
jgi:hypothetical protein